MEDVKARLYQTLLALTDQIDLPEALRTSHKSPPVKVVLPSNTKYQRVKIWPKYQWSSHNNKDYLSAVLEAVVTINDQTHQLTVCFEEGVDRASLPRTVALQRDGRIVYGSADRWVKLAATLGQLPILRLSVLLPKLHKSLESRSFESFYEQPGELLTVDREAVLALPRYQTSLTRHCPVVMEDFADHTVVEKLATQIGLEGLQALVKSGYQGPADHLETLVEILKDRPDQRIDLVQKTIRLLERERRDSGTVRLSIGCFERETLTEYLLSIERPLLEVLDLHDWAQIANHAPKQLQERLKKRFVEMDHLFETDSYPTVEILKDVKRDPGVTGVMSPASETTNVDFIIHCTIRSQDINDIRQTLLAIMKSGFLGQGGEQAGHGIPATSGTKAGEGFGVYTAVRTRDREMFYDSGEVPPLDSGYGHVCFVFSPKLLDRTSDFRSNLPQRPGDPPNENYFIHTQDKYVYPKDLRGQVIYDGARAIFRDKIPLKYLEEIWVGDYNQRVHGYHGKAGPDLVDKVKQVLRESKHPEFAELVRPLPKVR
jgi:hypothetical protein